MCSLVTSPIFQLRKRLDTFLHELFPDRWLPLYVAVTFTRMRYHRASEVRDQQCRVGELKNCPRRDFLNFRA